MIDFFEGRFPEDRCILSSFSSVFKDDEAYQASHGSLLVTWYAMETFTKQLRTLTEINDDIPEFVKSDDFIESLKNNKEGKGLPWYVAEYMLPVVEKKLDQTVEKVFGLLDVK